VLLVEDLLASGKCESQTGMAGRVCFDCLAVSPGFNGANNNIPPPTSGLANLTSLFAAQGLSQKDMVALSGNKSNHLLCKPIYH
jgi:hypothetical protein